MEDLATLPELPPGPEPKSTQATSKVSFLAADLTLVGTLKTSSDLVIEGTVEGDIQAFRVTLGEQSFLHGEVTADDLTVWGRVEGQLSGLKVHLASTARVSGDIRHRILAIDAGAQFEGSAQRLDADPAAQTAAPISPQRASSITPTEASRNHSPSAV